MHKEMTYGLGGFLLGVLVTVCISAINSTNNYGMMGLMGNRTNTSNSQNVMMENIDRHFIEEMIPHHESAITMTNIAVDKAQHPEIKTLAANIKTSQSAEIEKMKTWYKNWYGVAVPTNEDEDGNGMMDMHDHMMGKSFDADTQTLDNASNFDKAFIEEMIPHHQMAVMMAKMLKSSTTRPEMKQLADGIIRAQSSEISQMRAWYTDWGFKN